MAESSDSSLRELVASQAEVIKELRAEIVTLRARVAELEYRLGADSSNSSCPPSSDPPWKKPAKPRSSRGRSGRKPGKQPGDPGVSRPLCDTPDQVVVIAPGQVPGLRTVVGRCRVDGAGPAAGRGPATGPGAVRDRVPVGNGDLPMLRGGHHPSPQNRAHSKEMESPANLGWFTRGIHLSQATACTRPRDAGDVADGLSDAGCRGPRSMRWCWKTQDRWLEGRGEPQRPR